MKFNAYKLREYMYFNNCTTKNMASMLGQNFNDFKQKIDDGGGKLTLKELYGIKRHLSLSAKDLASLFS